MRRPAGFEFWVADLIFGVLYCAWTVFKFSVIATWVVIKYGSLFIGWIILTLGRPLFYTVLLLWSHIRTGAPLLWKKIMAHRKGKLVLGVYTYDDRGRLIDYHPSERDTSEGIMPPPLTYKIIRDSFKRH